MAIAPGTWPPRRSELSRQPLKAARGRESTTATSPRSRADWSSGAVIVEVGAGWWDIGWALRLGGRRVEHEETPARQGSGERAIDRESRCYAVRPARQREGQRQRPERRTVVMAGGSLPSRTPRRKGSAGTHIAIPMGGREFPVLPLRCRFR